MQVGIAGLRSQEVSAVFLEFGNWPHITVFCLCPLVAQKIVATRKKQQLSIGPCKSLPNSPSHSSVCSAQVSAVHISQVCEAVLEVGQRAVTREQRAQIVLPLILFFSTL